MSTESDKLKEFPEPRASTEQEIEKLKAPMTILFSDIQGSTAFAEQKGDAEYLLMIARHNSILFPIIEAHAGCVVKTLGDAILAKFDDSVGAIKAAVRMQRALAEDREGRDEGDQIRIRIGLHCGIGLLKDNDVFGDVVNAASRVQHQAEGDQILVTDALLDATKTAGFEYAKIDCFELKGKKHSIDLFALLWSESAAKQLIDEIQERYERRFREYERRFRELKKRLEDVEEEFDSAGKQWRGERRDMNAEIERLEEAGRLARQVAREQLSEDLHSELRFQLETANQARRQIEQELATALQNFEAERKDLKAQIAGMQSSFLDSMERSNNPARMAMALRDQVEVHVAEAKRDWQLQWEGERKRLNAEIVRLKHAAGLGAADGKKDAARRALLEKLGKLPAGTAGAAARTAEQWEHEFHDAKIQWGTEREQLALQIKRLENDVHRAQDGVRSEIYQEMRAQYEPRITECERERQRLEKEIQSLTGALVAERQRLTARIEQLQKALPEAQEATRKQTLAEMQAEYNVKEEEADRLRSRSERKYQEMIGDLDDAYRRVKKQIANLEEELIEAKAGSKAKRSRTTSS